jgi:O-antigen/teichoic acid export membrane protein
MIANSKNHKEAKNLCGMGYLVNLFSSGLYIVILYIVIGLYKDIKINFIVVFFAQGIILNDLLNWIAIALKRAKILIINNFIINLTILSAFALFKTTYSNYLIIYFLAYFLYSTLIFFIAIKPSFNNIRVNFSIALTKVKNYGFYVYIGRLTSMGAYDLDKLLIKSYFPVENVGYYNLGLSCIRPITMFSDALMSIYFRGLSTKTRIGKKIMVVNVVWLVIVAILFVTVGKWLFGVVFGAKYAIITTYFYGFAIIAVLSGLYVPIISFLSVKGCGKYLRNTSFVTALSSIIFNIALVPKYNIKGAIIATILSLFFDDIAFFYYYRKAVKDLEEVKILRVS